MSVYNVKPQLQGGSSGGNDIFENENIIGAFKLTFDRTEGENPQITYYNINKSIECVNAEFNLAIMPVADSEKESLTKIEFVASSLEELGSNAGWFLTENQLGYSTGMIF